MVKEYEFLRRFKNNKNSEHIIFHSPYINMKTKMSCECTICKHKWETIPAVLVRENANCPKCSKRGIKTHEEFVNNVIKSNNGDIIEFLNTYNNDKSYMKCKCKICNYEWSARADHLQEGHGCPCCSGNICVSGLNDVVTKNPQYIDYFEDVDIAKTILYGSSKMVRVKCPHCGHRRTMSAQSISSCKSICDYCSDCLSYPNKFLRAFLKQLPVKNRKYEYSQEWSNSRQYDGYFEYQNQKYIVEMDGGFHNKDNGMSGQTAEESRLIDELKDKMAIENNHIIIRIDCNKSKLNYIRENILNSMFYDLFDLSCIDWNKCHEFAISNIAKEVCEYSVNHPQCSSSEIAEVFSISSWTVRKYLHQGNQIGISDFKFRRKVVVAKLDLNKDIVIDIYESIKAASNSINPNKHYSSSIKSCCEGERHYSMGYRWKYIKDINERYFNDENLLNIYKKYKEELNYE